MGKKTTIYLKEDTLWGLKSIKAPTLSAKIRKLVAFYIKNNKVPYKNTGDHADKDGDFIGK